MDAALSTVRHPRLLAAGLPLLYVLLLAWLLIGPLWGQPGLPDSADGTLHLHRAAAVARSWSSGVLWPRWFPDVYQGLGAPTFHYYSPLFYLLVAPLQLLGLPLDLAAKLIITVAFVTSGLATWAWLRRLMGPVAGLAGATLYLAQPSLFREYYFQGDYPQLLALLLLPVAMWAFTGLYLDDRWFHRLAAPLSLGLLIISHNITAMLGAIILGLYSLALLLWRPSWLSGFRVILGVVLGLAVSAFFWLPAIADMDLVRVQNLQEGFFHFGQYFVSWRDLLAAPPVMDGRAANPPFPHTLGWAAWLVIAAGALTLVVSFLRRSGQADVRFWGATGLLLVLVCIAFARPVSEFFWERLSLLAFVEFPSRWLGPAALGVALVGGVVMAACKERLAWLLLLGLILVVALTTSVFLFPHQPFRSIDSYSVSKLQSYERRSYAWGLTSGNEFLPRWASAPPLRPNEGQLLEERLLPEGANWSWQTPHRATLQAQDGTWLPAQAWVLPVHYFPAWGATADGRPLTVEPAEGGFVGFSLSQPAREIVLQWQGTFWERVGIWLTLIVLAGWILWVGLALRRGAREERRGTVQSPQTWHAWLAPLILLVLLILARGAIRIFDLGWFQRSSPLGEVSHVANPTHETLSADGRPTVTLLGWELLSASPRPGTELQVRLYWQGEGRITQDLHSFAFLYTPTLQRAWAVVQNHNPGRIPTRNWSQRLYYIDELDLPLPLDVAPATYTIAVGMVDAEGERLTVADTADDLILLDEVKVEPLKAGRFQPLQAEVATPARFEASLRLQGYDLLPEPGGPVLRLYWEVLETPTTDQVTFVHLLDEQGERVAQFDGPPLEGLLPTSQWPAGSLLVDRRKLELPEGLKAGDYRFLAGLYEQDTGKRWSIQPEAGAEGHFADDALIIPFYVPP
jgi:hypothetical protein